MNKILKLFRGLKVADVKVLKVIFHALVTNMRSIFSKLELNFRKTIEIAG